MTQITGIGFSNFRVFSKGSLFNLSPISIFTGTNSSGKSSVFKGLLLLKNNVEDFLNLSFSGEEHKLGTFANTLNNNPGKEEIEFDLRLDKKDAVLNTFDCLFFEKFIFNTKYKASAGNSEGGSLTESWFFINDEEKENLEFEDILIRIKQDSDEVGLYFNLKYFLNKLTLKILPEFNSDKDTIIFQGEGRFSAVPGTKPNLRYANWFESLLSLCEYDGKLVSQEVLRKIFDANSIVIDKNNFEDLVNHLEEKILGKFLCFSGDPNFALPYSDGLIIDTFNDIFTEYKKMLSLDDFFEINLRTVSLNEFLGESLEKDYTDLIGEITLKSILKDDFIFFCREFIIPEINYILNSIKFSLKKLHYIGSSRATSQRLYTNQSQGSSFNQLLLEAGQKWGSLSKRKNYTGSPYNFVQKWIKEFCIADEITIERIKGIATEVYFSKNGNKVDLIDLGFGVTQFLPILLHIGLYCESKEKPYASNNYTIYQNNGPLLLIEEPEANLHPKLQSLLADFFVDVVKTFEVTLLLETHSEYLIRRMQVLTAAKELEPENSVIYYLNGDKAKEKEGFITKININPDGSLTDNFGPGFIDEATNWRMELVRLKNAGLQNLN